jgi:hypothetical protein
MAGRFGSLAILAAARQQFLAHNRLPPLWRPKSKERRRQSIIPEIANLDHGYGPEAR